MNFIIIESFSDILEGGGGRGGPAKMGKAKRSPKYAKAKKAAEDYRDRWNDVRKAWHGSEPSYQKARRRAYRASGGLKKFRSSGRRWYQKYKGYENPDGGHHNAHAHGAINKAGDIRREHGTGSGRVVYGGMGSTAKQLLRWSKTRSKLAKRRGFKLP